jgi:3-isopropylmalate dehydrogenase
MPTIALLPGDGTGREVVAEARKVLDAAADAYGLDLSYDEIACGAKQYEETGDEWEESGLERAEGADAILLGAVGWPGVTREDGEIAGAGVVFGLRFGLDLYANVRPCNLYEGVPHRIHDDFTRVWDADQVDMHIVRENTEEFYTPARGTLERGGTRQVAADTGLVTREGAERVIRYAHELCERRGRGAPGDGTRRVTCVDKANVLEGSRLFRGVYDEVNEEYPGIEADRNYVDAFTQWLVRNPEWYDTVVTTNMMGDIVTDLAAVLQGGMGMAASANVGDGHAMFEPVHGSSPKHAGEDRVNPIACVDSAKLLLEWLGTRRGEAAYEAAAEAVGEAIRDLLREGAPVTYDLGGEAATSDVGDALAKRVRGS